MSKHPVQYWPSVKKKIGKLDGSIKPLVRERIGDLTEDPFDPLLKAKHMKGEWEGFKKVHCKGKAKDWRIIFRVVDGEVQIVEVADIRHRGDPGYGKS